jgi:hypothetical protein
MVVDDFYILGAGGRPSETNTELAVHTDTILTGPVALEEFKAVAGRNAEVFDSGCDLQLP